MSNETNNSNNRKWLWIGGGILAVLIMIGALMFFNNRDAEPEQAGTGDIVTVTSGDLAASATASGQIEAQQAAQLALSASGEVAEIPVEVGDEVTFGQELLQLDSAELERNVAAAEQALASAEANLANLLAPPSDADLTAARANVTSAQAAYDDLVEGPTESDLAAADANLRAAQANVWAASEQLEAAQQGATEAEIASAQADLIAAQGEQQQTQELYDNLLKCYDFDLPDGSEKTICPGWGNPEEITRYNLQTANANLEVAQATLNALTAGPDADELAVAQANLAASVARRDAAQANYDLLALGATDTQLATSRVNLANAQITLDRLEDGPTDEQIALTEAQVEQARISLERAQNQLTNATLTAPFDGVVTAIYVNEGELANGIVMEMVNPDTLEVILEVDEVDIGDLAVGQAATLTLESWPDEEIPGEIVAIAPEATADNSALVTYEVSVALGETELPIRVGMTANANLTTAETSDVLLLPNNAINANLNAGTYTVNLITTDDNGNQVVEEVEITIGLRDDIYTQITSGLSEGDQVMVGNTTPNQTFGPAGDGPGNGGPFGG